MNEDPKPVIYLLLINDGNRHKVSAKYEDPGEAVNIACLLNKLAAPIKDGRYSVAEVEESDTDTLTKYGYFDYDWDSEEDLTIKFEEEEEGEDE